MTFCLGGRALEVVGLGGMRLVKSNMGGFCYFEAVEFILF